MGVVLSRSHAPAWECVLTALAVTIKRLDAGAVRIPTPERGNEGIGNIKHQSICEIWRSKDWSVFRGEITISDLPSCNTCNHKTKCELKSCRLRALNTYGDFYGRTPGCVAAVDYRG